MPTWLFIEYIKSVILVTVTTRWKGNHAGLGPGVEGTKTVLSVRQGGNTDGNEMSTTSRVDSAIRMRKNERKCTTFNQQGDVLDVLTNTEKNGPTKIQGSTMAQVRAFHWVDFTRNATVTRRVNGEIRPAITSNTCGSVFRFNKHCTTAACAIWAAIGHLRLTARRKHHSGFAEPTGNVECSRCV